MIPPCLTLSNIRYVSRVKWSNPRKGVAPSPTRQCSSYWKENLLVALDYGRQLYFIIRFGRLAEIWWSVCISKSQRGLCVSFSWIDSGLCLFQVKLHLLSQFPVDHPAHLVVPSFIFFLYSLHSLIMWLIVSTLSL